MVRSGIRTRRLAVVATAAVGLVGLPAFGPAASAAPGAPNGRSRASAASGVAPTPTPARANTPTIVVAVGDSITQSTGTGELSKENPKNSWATGNEVNSVAARLSVPTTKRYNLSKNGARMTDMVGELKNGKSGGSGDVAAMPATTGLVLVEFGGNDLCRDSVAAMTSVASYKSQFEAGLAQVRAQAPDALIQILSVPDIYNLWYIRGAPQNATYHPESESDQAGGLNGARTYWGQSFFPCQSLLTNPSSYAAADRQRRLDVRTRDKAYNDVLKSSCDAVVRCFFDDDYLFNLTSNRVSPPDGALLPQSQWRFTDSDISRNEGVGKYLCPVQGVIAGGCGDHFHPTKGGQGKVADAAWASGPTWSDHTFPTATVTTLGTPVSGDTFRARVEIAFGGSDASGIKGQETRTHWPDGTVTPWTPSIGIAPHQVITTVGTSYVEVRSFDNNGNRSASTVKAVSVSPAVHPSAPGRPALTATAGGVRATWVAPADDGGAAISGYQLTTYVDSPANATGSPASVVGLSTVPTTVAGHVVRYGVAAVNSAGVGTASALSDPTVAPFATLPDFVRQQYVDFVGRPATAGEASSGAGALGDGSVTPAALVAGLMDAPWWDGAYGPATRLYKAYFLRIPDPSGLDYWAGRRRAGRTLDSIAQQFARSTEFLRRYGALSDGEFVDQVYVNVFDRAPDPSGRDFYIRRLAAGWSRGRVVLQLSESSENVRHMAATVAVVELERGLFAKAPTAAEVDLHLPTFASGGFDALFAELVSDARYRGRVVP